MKTTQPSQPGASASTAPGQARMQAIVQHRYGTGPEEVLALEQVATPAIAVWPREDMHIAAKSDHDVARPFPADLEVIRRTLLSSRYILPTRPDHDVL